MKHLHKTYTFNEISKAPAQLMTGLDAAISLDIVEPIIYVHERHQARKQQDIALRILSNGYYQWIDLVTWPEILLNHGVSP